MDIYAAKARNWMDKNGVQASDFVRVVIKSRHAGSLNPVSQCRKTTTVEAVLESRMVSNPLTLFMCSSIGDGAAVLFSCSEEYATAHAIRPVYIRASSIVTATADGSGDLVAVRTTKQAY
jgi:acetyl-CoA acyltransferase